ncbi:hypothetical protein ABET41_11645 [Metabacillus fastidiosus]|uniref:Uncharacterized protein n=1 Tax=Metabacillus fastidiosus TaxID=1458 RepID=A0ABU6NWL9_9BACI|nr:hypothetical protein [Metabacillus fastidiosus]
MTKHWNYEDDHDYDDTIDYKSKGYGYWYGKYIPQEQIDKLCDDPKSSTGLIVPLLTIAGIGVIGMSVYGVACLASSSTDKIRDKKEERNL